MGVLRRKEIGRLITKPLLLSFMYLMEIEVQFKLELN